MRNAFVQKENNTGSMLDWNAEVQFASLLKLLTLLNRNAQVYEGFDP